MIWIYLAYHGESIFWCAKTFYLGSKKWSEKFGCKPLHIWYFCLLFDFQYLLFMVSLLVLSSSKILYLSGFQATFRRFEIFAKLLYTAALKYPFFISKIPKNHVYARSFFGIILICLNIAKSFFQLFHV